MTTALEAFRAVNFDWTRQLKSIWADPVYHVPSLHEAAIDDIMDYFVSRTRDPDPNDEPLGKVIVGPAGYGKTHLIGELRRRICSSDGWFVLLDFIGIKDFWSSVALGFLNSLQVRMPGNKTQYDQLIIKLAEQLNLKRDLTALTTKYQKRPQKLVSELVNLLVAALSRVEPVETRKNRDVVTALVLLISQDLDYHSVAHAWLQGMSLEPEVVKPLGFREENSPIKVVEGLSWLMSLVGPTLIAVDQIDAIVSASNASSRTATQTNEEQREARSIVELLAEGLMDLHEKKRRTVSVISCLEATWKVLGGATASITDRYQKALPLYVLNSRETTGALVGARVGPAYQAVGFTPPYPTWPFTNAALDSAIGFTPRQLLKRCEDFRKHCVSEGQVRECLTLNVEELPADPPKRKPDSTSAIFEQELEAARVSQMMGADGEEPLQSLLDATLRLLIKHFALPDSIDVEVQRDPDQRRPSLHGRLSFTFHDEGDREQHYCFRILDHTHAIAFQSRLKAAMTASGIDTALKFRHLFVLRREKEPSGKKTEALVAQFKAAGGKFVAPTEQDLRVFVALQALTRKDLPEFEEWLANRKPLFETEFFRSVGLAPPAFLNKASRSNGNASTEETTFPNNPRLERQAVVSANRVIPIGHRYDHGKTGDTVFLDAALLPRHVAIFAGSGSGKTVFLRRIVEEAALIGIPAIVLDINNDLSRLGDRWPKMPEGMASEDLARADAYHAHSEVVIWTPGANSGNPIFLPLLPDFSRIGHGPQADDERKQAIEMALATVRPYVGGSGQKVALRQGVLADAVRSFAKEGNDALDDLIEHLADLPEGVSQIGNAYKLAGEIADQLRAAVATNPLLRSEGRKIDPGQFFNGANGKTRISVINFSGLGSQEARQAFVNQLQMTLFTWIKQNPSPTGRLYVLDEAQNFAPSQIKTACKASAQSLAAQARKYGLGMILATQLPKGIDNGIVSNCTTHVYGRMSSPAALSAIEELITAKGGEAKDIGRLTRGEFYFSTDGFPRPVKVRTPLCLSWHAPNPPTAEEVIQKAHSSRSRMQLVPSAP